MSNTALNKSKNTLDNDEFYTLYKDIELEINHYLSQLKGKVVYCNCDNPYQSNYVQYFIKNFNKIGLKGLVATCIQPTHGLYMHLSSVPSEITTATVDTVRRWLKPHVQLLNGNGGFQTPECMGLLKQCDVVITNPPFSLFRLWYDVVNLHRKRYLVLCNMNTCLSANISADIVEGKARFGCSTTNRSYDFIVPNKATKRVSIGYICWLTNMRIIPKPFIRTIDRPASAYPKYDGQNVIKVSKVAEIPSAYTGVMGVPITFLFKHNPMQFEIVGIASHGKDNKYDLFSPHLNGEECYKAILIRKR